MYNMILPIDIILKIIYYFDLHLYPIFLINKEFVKLKNIFIEKIR